MIAQIADRAEPQSRRRLAAHGQRVRVGEAERRADGQPEGRQPPAHLVEVGHRRVLQDRPADRPRVLGIDVDVAVHERAIDDPRAAETELALDGRLRGLLGDLRHDLRDHVALGERLRAHAHRRCRLRREGPAHRQQHRRGDHDPGH
jgi:hypothetical protein